MFDSPSELEEDEAVRGQWPQGQNCPKLSAVYGQTVLTKRNRDGRAKMKESQSGLDRIGEFLKLGVKQTSGTQLGA